MQLPAWDSINLTTRIHNFCELAGIILFMLVVFLELFSYFYGNRHDTLVKQAQEATDKHHAAEINILHSEITKERERSAGLASKLAKLRSRRLTTKQVEKLSASLKDLRLQAKAITLIRLGDEEAYKYAISIMVAINKAGLYTNIEDVGTMSPPRYGLIVTQNLKPAFDAASIHIDGVFQRAIGLTEVPEILVGLKPPPF